MRLIDLHTHHKDKDGNLFILCCTDGSGVEEKNISIGLHPWFIDADSEPRMQKIARLAPMKNVKAIGECGIDKVGSKATIERQIEILKAHIELSEQLQKPLILHIVKGQEIIIHLHKERRPTQTWIVHGFRGKPEQAQQYIAEGLYLSYGTKFNRESLLNTPINRLLLERDEDNTPLAQHYYNIAEILKISTEELAAAIEHNCKSCGIEFTQE